VGAPSDDRPDVKNEELVGRVWTGVLPCWTVYGQPVESSYNKAKLPGYLKSFVDENNSEAKKIAMDAIEKVSGH